jgi:hypothetical protein
LPRLLLESPLHDAGADSKFLANLEDAIATCPKLSSVKNGAFKLERVEAAP